MTHKKIKCLVVDDEPIGREIVESYISEIANLALTASCQNAFEALDILQHEEIDLVFSDIQMPRINGLELVKSLPNPPAIIFITAYDRFAIDSFDLNITDYLLKPVSFDRFLKAVNKAISQITLTEKRNTVSTNPNPYVFVKSNNKLNKILLNEIIYIESIKDYIKIHTPDNMVVVYSSMKAIEEKLPADKFYRIHQSYITSLEHIKSLMGNTAELVNGISLPISKNHKTDLYKKLNIQEGH